MVRHQLRARGVRDPAVLQAMTQVPRHRFVSEADAADAYADKALPTADGQTISQPYMVAVMTEQLRIEPGVKVLEVGTGSGYQAAILAHMGAQVVSIERSETLARQACDVLDQLGWSDRVRVVVGDGTLGYPQEAPYDRILVTAGAPQLPQAYRDQLADGGRIVVPIGGRHDQELMTFERCGRDWHSHAGIRCRFVALIGNAGWKG